MIETSVTIIAIAFVALVIYLIMTSRALNATLYEVNQMLIDLRKQLDGTGGEAQKLVEHTNHITLGLKQKIEALNPLFNAVANLGEILEHKAVALKEEAFAESHPSNVDIEEKKKLSRSDEWIKVADVLGLAVLSIHLWQNIKKKR